MFSPESYDLKLLGTETMDTVPAWKIAVEPKLPGRVTYRGTIWVSRDDFAIVRVLAEPGKNPSWMLDRSNFDARYMRRGDVWVPATNVSTTHVRMGGEAKVTIDYGSYPLLATLPLPPNSQTLAARNPHPTPMPPLGRSLR